MLFAHILTPLISCSPLSYASRCPFSSDAPLFLQPFRLSRCRWHTYLLGPPCTHLRPIPTIIIEQSYPARPTTDGYYSRSPRPFFASLWIGCWPLHFAVAVDLPWARCATAGTSIVSWYKSLCSPPSFIRLITVPLHHSHTHVPTSIQYSWANVWITYHPQLDRYERGQTLHFDKRK